MVGKRRQDEDRAAAMDALLGAAQERGIPTMRVDDPDEVSISLGVAAYQQGDLARAEETLRTVAGSGRRSAARAACYLGELLQEQGDLAGAERAFRQAATGEDRETAAIAIVNLAVLLMGRGTTRPRRPTAGRWTPATRSSSPWPGPAWPTSSGAGSRRRRPGAPGRAWPAAPRSAGSSRRR